jgi:hypothetical protein
VIFLHPGGKMLETETKLKGARPASLRAASKEADNLWYCVQNRVVSALNLEFAGIGQVLDHPFGYKYWVVKETNKDLHINSLQLCNPLTICKEANSYVEIEDIHDFLKIVPLWKLF